MAAMPLEFTHSVELPSRHTSCECSDCITYSPFLMKILASVDETKSEAWSVKEV